MSRLALLRRLGAPALPSSIHCCAKSALLEVGDLVLSQKLEDREENQNPDFGERF
jgi:hypothetical protein